MKDNLKNVIEKSIIESEKIYEKYSNDRPFYSEADFQFRLALSLKKKLKNKVGILLEYPIKKGSGLSAIDDRDQHIDIMLRTKKELVPIELKFTRKEVGAGDMRRYHIWEDIKRIERLVQSKAQEYKRGFVVVVTDDKYKKDYKKDKDGLYYKFGLHNREKITKGNYEYKEGGRDKNREKMKIYLEKDHGEIKWKENVFKNKDFDLLVIEIKNDEK